MIFNKFCFSIILIKKLPFVCVLDFVEFIKSNLLKNKYYFSVDQKSELGKLKVAI